MKGVFEFSGASRYKDRIEQHYHFPRRYLPFAEACVGDWILYRETGAAGGRMAYVAAARVTQIDPDPELAGHFYARVTQFTEFDVAVPYRDQAGRFEERMLRELPNPAFAGRALHGKSVRTIDGIDFAAIVAAGLRDTLAEENAIRLELDERYIDTATKALLEQPPTERRMEQMLVNKKIRSAAFRGHVLAAYDYRCAVTGLRIINGGGKAEAQAAHIWAVADGGPDIVTNGIALSATAHWLFDRHLISLDENLGLLVSHNKVPQELIKLFPSSGRTIHLPADRLHHPRPEFVARHRARFMGGD